MEQKWIKNGAKWNKMNRKWFNINKIVIIINQLDLFEGNQSKKPLLVENKAKMEQKGTQWTENDLM